MKKNIDKLIPSRLKLQIKLSLEYLVVAAYVYDELITEKCVQE